MKDQHEKIKGYRDLTQTEIDMMNEAKSLAEQVGVFVEKCERGFFNIENGEQVDTDKRWVAIAKTDLQKGFMALTRAIAQPTTF